MKIQGRKLFIQFLVKIPVKVKYKKIKPTLISKFHFTLLIRNVKED